MSRVIIKEAGPDSPIYKVGLVVGGNYSKRPLPDTKAETSAEESPKPETSDTNGDTPVKED